MCQCATILNALCDELHARKINESLRSWEFNFSPDVEFITWQSGYNHAGEPAINLKIEISADLHALFLLKGQEAYRVNEIVGEIVNAIRNIDPRPCFHSLQIEQKEAVHA